jgi:hypothetical protein
LYRNERVVGAGAYDDVIKTWITENEATLVGKLPSVPFADSGDLLRLLVATAASGKSAAAGSGAAGAGAAIPVAAGGGSGGGGRDGMLAEALDTTELPAMKGEDGQEKVVPPPASFLSLVQADALVAKRPLLEAALCLGQSEAGADACANLGQVHDHVDAATGKVTKVRMGDEALNWAMT